MNTTFSSNRAGLTNLPLGRILWVCAHTQKGQGTTPHPFQDISSCWPSPAAALLGAASGLITPEKQQDQIQRCLHFNFQPLHEPVTLKMESVIL